MTDSVAVFPPGYRLTDSSTGAPLSGAIVSFFDAGTTTPKTVYSDANLTVSLGTSVTTDALGYPTSDGTTKTMVYVGTAAYKVRVATSGGTTIAEHDNIKGAVEIVDPGTLSVVATRPVVTKSLAYTVVSGDQNRVIAVDCTNADVTITLPSAVTVGSGWAVTVQHAGTANNATVATVSSQTIISGATSLGTSTTLRFNGEEMTLVSDGGNWRASPRIQQFVPAGTVIMHAAATAPTGWLICNGAAISRTTYAALFAAIGTTFGVGDGSTTFAIPDLRGVFVRGLDSGKGYDTGRTFGSYQADDLKAHTHTYFLTNQTDTVDGIGSTGVADTHQNTLNTGSTGGTETRPKNVALIYIIKH